MSEQHLKLFFEKLPQFLVNNKGFCLPGIGSFIVQAEDYKVDPGKNFVYPRGRWLSFEKELTIDNASFIAFFRSFYSLDPSTASKVPAMLADYILEKLHLNAQYTVERFGKFVRDASGSVTFIAEKVNYYEDGKGAKPIALESFENNAMGTLSAPISTSGKSNKRRGTILFWLLLFLAILSLIVLFTWPLLNPAELFNGSSKYKAEEYNRSPLYDSVLASEKDSDKDKIDVFKDDSAFEKAILPEGEDPTGDALNVPEDALSKEDKHESPPTEEIEPDWKALEKALEKESDAGIVEFSRECVIIVGSFAKSRNVRRMINRVEEAGLHVYTAPKDTLTRVGIRFDCGVHDLRSTLEIYRSQFDDKAWVLKY